MTTILLALAAWLGFLILCICLLTAYAGASRRARRRHTREEPWRYDDDWLWPR